MTPRHLLMIAGLGVAAGLAWFGNRDGQSDLAEAVLPDARQASAPASRAPAAAPRPAADQAELPILTLLDRVAATAQIRQGQHARRLFAVQSWAPAAIPVTAVSVPPPAPAAPALPFSYIGKQMQGGQIEVFLAQGESVHVVRVHSLLDDTYRVDAISPTAVSFTYLPLNSTQQLSIGASD